MTSEAGSLPFHPMPLYRDRDVISAVYSCIAAWTQVSHVCAQGREKDTLVKAEKRTDHMPQAACFCFVEVPWVICPQDVLSACLPVINFWRGSVPWGGGRPIPQPVPCLQRPLDLRVRKGVSLGRIPGQGETEKRQVVCRFCTQAHEEASLMHNER